MPKHFHLNKPAGDSDSDTGGNGQHLRTDSLTILLAAELNDVKSSGSWGKTLGLDNNGQVGGWIQLHLDG